MTVIAVKNKVMASDSRECYGSRIDTDRSKKIYRLPDGSLFGASGSSSGIIQLKKALISTIKAVLKKRSDPLTMAAPMLKKTLALWLTSSGLYLYEKGSWQIVDNPYAIGSGSDYAITALDYGKSAVEAVKAAIKRDIYCGGRIQVYQL
jgi:20S proteasome alpha/beta subunit